MTAAGQPPPSHPPSTRQANARHDEGASSHIPWLARGATVAPAVGRPAAPAAQAAAPRCVPDRWRPVSRPTGAAAAGPRQSRACRLLPRGARHGRSRVRPPQRATRKPWTASSATPSATTCAAISRARRCRRYASEAALAAVQPDDPAMADQAFGSAGRDDHRRHAFRGDRDPRPVGDAEARPADHGADGDHRRPGSPGVLRAEPWRDRPQRDPRQARRDRAARRAGARRDRWPGRRSARRRQRHAPSSSSERRRACPPARPRWPSRVAPQPGWSQRVAAAGNDYRTRIEQIETPATGSRRERLSGFMAAEARAFERAIADAPEQWWTVFFPIWDDIRA